MRHVEAALEIAQKLAREHPESAGIASDAGRILADSARIDMDAGRFVDARVRFSQAIALQRKALAADPASSRYRQLLNGHLTGMTLAARGLNDTGAVADAERELFTLIDSDPAMSSFDARLAEVIKRNQLPKDEADRLRLGQRAYDKRLYAAAARLWGEALAANPKLGESRQMWHRYNAACAAALAGSGQGRDEPKLDEAAKAKLGAQALVWLKAELTAWDRVAKTAEPGIAELVAKSLAHWKQDADLACVRESKPLDMLPEAERKKW
jgi:tetratricopeptide (TPR) repeat protein